MNYNFRLHAIQRSSCQVTHYDFLFFFFCGYICNRNAAGYFGQSNAAPHCACVLAFISSVLLILCSSITNSVQFMIKRRSREENMALSQRDTSSSSSVQSQSRRVTLERNGRRVECGVQQVTTENLRKMFQVCGYVTCGTT